MSWAVNAMRPEGDDGLPIDWDQVADHLSVKCVDY